MATRGGSEMLVHHVQRLLEENPEFGVLKTDVSNAFNNVSRQHLLQEVASHFPELYGHVKQMYGQSSPLLYFNGHNTCITVLARVSPHPPWLVSGKGTLGDGALLENLTP